MRQKDILVRGFEDIKTLYQYLYMDENNCITIDNGLAKLEIKMDEHGNFNVRNMNYPDSPPTGYNDMMYIPHMLLMIEQLKEMPPIEYPKSFKSRWDEIKSLKAATVVLSNM